MKNQIKIIYPGNLEDLTVCSDCTFLNFPQDIVYIITGTYALVCVDCAKKPEYVKD